MGTTPGESKYMGEQASRADVARLFGRVAFGATKADLDRHEGVPYAELVDQLLAAPVSVTNPVERRLAEVQSSTTPRPGQLWWLQQMLTAASPLGERMTLFWHDHFATAHPKVRGDELMIQNQTLRRHALGNVRDLVDAITIDPAMLRWLDGETNIVGQPNENYAREFFELFTLGTVPQVFSEADVREAARAFTGWVGEFTPVVRTGQFRVARHDPGTKTILGTTFGDLGEAEHRRVSEIALSHPIAPRFIAYKLVQHFAYVPDTSDLLSSPDPLVDDVAHALTATNWDIRSGLRALLLSDRFRYPDAARGRQVVRQPIEIAVHAMKVLGLTRVDDTSLVNELERAGQVPFEPPNVGGWLLGTAWLTPSGFLGRYGCIQRILQLGNLLDPLPALRKRPPSSDIQHGGAQWAAMMGLDQLSPPTLAAIGNYVDAESSGVEHVRQDGIFLLIANSPDWQVM